MSNPKENQTQNKAFLYYFELGDERTIEAVAKEFGKSKKTIYKWSHTFQWKKRIEEKNRELNERLAKEHMDLIASMNKDLLHLVNKSIGLYATSLHLGEVEIKSVLDLKSLVEMYKKLAPAEPIEINNTISGSLDTAITEEDRTSMNQLATAILSLKSSNEEDEDEED